MSSLYIVLKELSTIFSSSKDQTRLKEKLFIYLSKEKGFQIFLEEKLNLENINIIFPKGQNPFSSYCQKEKDESSLFKKECRDTNCQGPCLFKHNGKNRTTDLLAVTRFKLIIFNILMSILDLESPEDILLDYREDYFEQFSERVFLMNTGKYPLFKLQLMKCVYKGSLFRENNYPNPRQEFEQDIGINLYKYNNQIRASDLMFMISCCYLPHRIVDTIYFIMKVNNQMTNLQIKNWKQELHSLVSNLLKYDNKFSRESIKEKNLIYKFETEILKLPLNEQREFRYLLTHDQQLMKRDLFLNDYIEVS